MIGDSFRALHRRDMSLAVSAAHLVWTGSGFVTVSIASHVLLEFNGYGEELTARALTLGAVRVSTTFVRFGSGTILWGFTRSVARPTNRGIRVVSAESDSRTVLWEIPDRPDLAGELAVDSFEEAGWVFSGLPESDSEVFFARVTSHGASVDPIQISNE